MGLKRITNRKALNAKKSIIASFIHGLTAEQLDVYIDNDVIDLSSAKEFLKKLAKVVLCLTRN